MLDAVRDRDVIVVTRLDRLARSTKDLLEVSEIVSGIDAGLRSLGELWGDTTSPAGRAMPPDCQASSARRP
jgi:DNA invertase Pin-like site-specific DNA recombinase